MSKNGLGVALKVLRDRRELTIREVSTLAEIDHAYVYRLETGEKNSPSMEVMLKIRKALRIKDREFQIVQWLIEHPETSPDLVIFCLDDESVDQEILSIAASMSHRGNVRPEPAAVVERVKKLLADDF